MKEINNALWDDYKRVRKQIEESDIKDENYNMLLEDLDKIRNEIIKANQAEMENRVKVEQIEAENRREKIRNGITVGTFTVTTIVSVWTVLKTFAFDETGTFTGTMSRNIVNGFIPKLFKR